MILICFCNYNRDNVNNFKIFVLFEKVLNSDSFIKKFNYLLSFASLFFVIRYFWSQGLSVSFDTRTLFLSPILWLAYLLFAISWCLNINNKKINKDYILIWFSSLIGKYLPFKVGIPLFRISESKKYFDDFDTKRNIKTLIIEQLFLIFWGFYFGSLFLLPQNISFFVIAPVSIFIGLILTLLIGFTFKAFKQFVIINIYILFGQFLILTYLVYIFEFEFGYFDLASVASYVLVSSISLLFVGAPAGLGIREFLYIQLLNYSDLSDEIASFAIVIRVVFLINEVFLTFITRMYSNLSK